MESRKFVLKGTFMRKRTVTLLVEAERKPEYRLDNALLKGILQNA
ncbi:MAG: hypothetical protein JWN25_2680 [Verrucomicrobiales bacterium]|nr:hypothetical protein [Verrucomicrobiales bacterium]